jgi:TM2 domain-containing membrane protein YozV
MSDTTSSEDQPSAGEVFCRDCGAVISERAEICPECGVRQQNPPKSSVDTLVEELTGGGNPFVAAVLSVLLPGLGQLYNRELQKGIAVLVAGLIALASVAALVGLVLYPAVWLYAVWDAYVVAERQATERAAAEDGEETA